MKKLLSLEGFTRILSFAVGLLTVVAASLAYFTIANNRQPSTSNELLEVLHSQTKQLTELENVRNDVENEFNEFLKSISIPEGTEISIKIGQIEASIDELFEKLEIVDTITIAIQDSPERAMSIPILRRDVDAISQDVDESILSIKSEIDRIYDLGKWFLGLIGTMAVGVLSLAIGNFLHRSE